MEILAVFFVLISVLAMASHSTLKKWLITQNALTDREILVSQCGIGALMAFIFLALSGNAWNTLGPVFSENKIFWCAVLLTIAANTVIQYAGVRAQRYGENSFVAPIQALTPGLVTISAFLLREFPSTQGYLGIALIIILTYSHAREGQPLREYFKPLFFWKTLNIENMTKEERDKRMALRWAYASACFGSIGLMGDGLVARHGNMLLGVGVELLALTTIYFFLPDRKQKKDVATLGERMKKYRLPVISMGTLFGLPFILLGVAFRLAPIAYIGSLKRLSIFFTVILSVWILKESQNKRRTLLAAGIVAGAMLLAFDPTQAKVLSSFNEYLSRIMR